MGHFSHNCKLSGLPITGGTPVVLIVMKPQESLYDNSEAALKKYGKTYMCSNDGPRLKFIPTWFPLFGDYDDYGGITNIVKDDNVEILEKFYGLTIEQLTGIITSNRKDDGYDNSLKVIKKKPEYPADWIEGEDHFDRYQRLTGDMMPFDGHYPDCPGKTYRVYRNGKMVKTTKKEYDEDFKLIHEHYARYEEWKKTNPDYDDDYKNPKYDEKYTELLTYSGMWIHGDVYRDLVKEASGDYFDKLDMGTPELLKALGFVEGKRTKRERYNRPFKQGNVTLYSDGTWIESKGEGLYSPEDLKKYCKKKGLDIDITEIASKDLTEQIYDYVIPTYKLNVMSREAVMERIKTLEKDEDADELFEILEGMVMNPSRISSLLLSRFMNTDKFRLGNVKNPITNEYIKAAKEKKLRSNVVEFWRFDKLMYSCGRFYDIVGTGPQDGEREDVLKVLETAVKIIKSEIKERSDEEDEYNNEQS